MFAGVEYEAFAAHDVGGVPKRDEGILKLEMRVGSNDSPQHGAEGEHERGISIASAGIDRVLACSISAPVHAVF